MQKFGLLLSVRELLQMDGKDWVFALKKSSEEQHFPVDEGHLFSWTQCYRFLSDVFQNHLEQFGSFHLLFEYMLPFEGGRRPDVILLVDNRVIILEFKAKVKPSLEDFEQAIHYREDIRKFHAETHKRNLTVESYLVVTETDGPIIEYRGIPVLTKSTFLMALNLHHATPRSKEETVQWSQSTYEPLPSILEATLRLFQVGKLPHIKNIADGEITDTLNTVKRVIHRNETKKMKKHIVFVSGVPGAGKTLVALKTLYDYNAYQYKSFHQKQKAIYTSGNLPLATVLQEQLSETAFNGSTGKTFIKPIKDVKREYLKFNNVPPFTTILFDEGQRAWDEQLMSRKGGFSISEPEALLQIGERIYQKHGHVTIVCFVGNGQQIYEGEEKGINLWVETLRNHLDWSISIPPTYRSEFHSVGVTEVETLHLNTSIRSNFIDTSKWVESVLALNIEQARDQIQVIQSLGFQLRVTRNPFSYKSFLDEKARNVPTLSYGLLVSSKAKKPELRKVLQQPTFDSYMKADEVGNWFIHKSKELTHAASEFDCQGLELDFPIVMFGGDYYIENGKWTIEPKTLNQYQKKPGQAADEKQYDNFPMIMENIYRVLLTRSRKGMVLYIPDIPRMQETYRFFCNIGVDMLN